MKVKNILIAVILFVTMPLYGIDSNKAQFEKGVEAYSAGDYQSALDLWLSIYKTGYNSFELDYNIGNAYFKLNDVPGAILFYERAALLNPTNDDVNYNLQIAQTRTVDKFEEIPQLFIKRWLDVFSLFFSSNTWAILSLLSFIICLVCVVLYFFSSKYKLKKAGFWIAVVLLLFSIISLSNSIRNKNLIHHSDAAIIFSSQVNGKSSPDASGTDLFLLHEGTKVYITDKVGEWYEIRLSDGNKGWIQSNSLEII